MTDQLPDTIQIQAYNLGEYSELVQKAFLSGYHFSFTNENFPTSFGSFFTCTMVLQKEQPVEAPEQPLEPSSEQTEGQVPASPKRRSKAV